MLCPAKDVVYGFQLASLIIGDAFDTHTPKLNYGNKNDMVSASRLIAFCSVFIVQVKHMTFDILNEIFEPWRLSVFVIAIKS